jgi:hypothetical protein
MSTLRSWCLEEVKILLRSPVLTAAGLALICACGEEPVAPGSALPPTAKETEEATVSPMVVATASIAGALDFSSEVADLKTRILPAFGHDADARALSLGLSTIEQTLKSGDRSRTRVVVQATRAALHSKTAGAANVDAVRLTLDAFIRALDSDIP